MFELTVTVTVRPTRELTEIEKDLIKNGVLAGANGAVIDLNNPNLVQPPPSTCLIPDYVVQ